MAAAAAVTAMRFSEGVAFPTNLWAWLAVLAVVVVLLLLTDA